jgi:hypothetical protein
LRLSECFIVGVSFGLFVKRILSHNACIHNSENSQNSVNRYNRHLVQLCRWAL